MIRLLREAPFDGARVCCRCKISIAIAVIFTWAGSTKKPSSRAKRCSVPCSLCSTSKMWPCRERQRDQTSLMTNQPASISSLTALLMLCDEACSLGHWQCAKGRRSNRVHHGARVWWCNRVQQGATGSSHVCSCVRSADMRPRAVQGGQGGAGKGTHDTRRVDFSQRVLCPPPLSPYAAALPSPSAPPPVVQQDKRMPARRLL